MAKNLREKDLMLCRSCGNEERASEGYPCVDCGTFVCMPMTPGPQKIDWPEH